MVNSFCTAEWLDVHPYFNTGHKANFNRPTTINMLPPSLDASGNAIRFRFTVADTDGLHQAQLFVRDLDSLIACKHLNGNRSTTVEFATTYIGSDINSVNLKVIDVNGNFTKQTFPVNITKFLLPAKVVKIPDAGLAMAVRAYLRLPPSAALTTHAMAKLTKLFRYQDRQITDLTGLEHATNLITLGLYGQKAITNASPLAGLKELKHLDLGETSISDASPVVGLKKLEYLNLLGTSISDASLVAGLKKLEHLYLSDTPIRDASALGGLTHLKTLTLPFDVSNISFLTKLTDLETLHLPRNVSNISSLTGLTKLKVLWLFWSQTSDVTPLARLTNLRILKLGGNQISDVGPLAKLVNLEELVLSDNPISDITPLTELTKLERLGLARLQITDIALLASFTSLRGLYLDGNQISNITSLVALTKLEELRLVENQISDIRPLAGLTKLKDLRLARNPILNISPLRTLLNQNPKLDLDIDTTQSAPVVQVGASERPGMYWIDTKNGTLHRLTSGKVAKFVPSVRNATSLAVDVAGGKLYWTEKTSEKSGRIRRANLKGNLNVRIIKELTSVPLNIVLDAAAGTLYLTNARGRIQRLNVDGSDFEPNLIAGLKTPKEIALDVSGGKIYWTEMGGRIRRANLDGSNVETVATGLATPTSIAVAGEHLYWTTQLNVSAGKIQRANLKGSNIRRLATVPDHLRALSLTLQDVDCIGQIRLAVSNGRTSAAKISKTLSQG